MTKKIRKPSEIDTLLEDLECTQRTWMEQLNRCLAERDYGKAHFRQGMMVGLSTAIETIKDRYNELHKSK